VRFKVCPRDVPTVVAARRMGLTETEFQEKLSRLLARGFPTADPDTGNFDLHAIDRWCDARHAHLFGNGSVMQARDARTVVPERIARMKAGTGRG
jgi:hypothetical protein